MTAHSNSGHTPGQVDRIYIPGIWSESTGGIATRYFVCAIHYDALKTERDKLLEALTLVCDRLSVVIESDTEDHGGASADDVQAYETALAALAKARGETL